MEIQQRVIYKYINIYIGLLNIFIRPAAARVSWHQILFHSSYNLRWWFSMLSLTEQKTCLSFVINSKIVTLAHLLNSLNSTTLDSGSEEFKEWSKYMEQLNQVWVLINKENEPAEWPMVSLIFIFWFLNAEVRVFIWQPPTDMSGRSGVLLMPSSAPGPVNTLNGWENGLGSASEPGKAHQEQLQADLKIRLDGGQGPGKIGPARQLKSAEERKKREKPWDTLADDLVFEFMKHVAGTAKEKLAVYCIVCDRKTYGCDTSWIKNYAKSCNVYNFNVLHVQVYEFYWN